MASADVFVRAWIEAEKAKGEVLVWLVGPTYEKTRAEFEYAMMDAAKLGMLADPNALSMPQQGSCHLSAKTASGGIIRVETKTGADPRDLVSKAPHFILMCEPATIPFQSFLRCLGRTAEKRGRLLCAGSFEGSFGWLPDTFLEWSVPNELGGRSFSLPSYTNRAVYPLGEDDPEIKRLKRYYEPIPGMYEERVCGIPAPTSGLVFKMFKWRGEGSHVGVVSFDEKLPVYLAVDPGGTNPYAVLAVQFPEHLKVRVIDEYYQRGVRATEDRIADLKLKSWWKKVAGGAIDVASPQEAIIWQRYGKVHLAKKQVKVEAGNRRLAWFLGVPDGFLIDQEHCPNTIQEFGKYRERKAREDHEAGPVPRDEFNHSLRALVYLLVARYGYVSLGAPSPDARPTRAYPQGPTAAIRQALRL